MADRNQTGTALTSYQRARVAATAHLETALNTLVTLQRLCDGPLSQPPAGWPALRHDDVQPAVEAVLDLRLRLAREDVAREEG